MKNLFLKFAASAALLTTSMIAFANPVLEPISGQIGFNGNAVVSVANGKIAEINFENMGMPGSPRVGNATGDFAPVLGQEVTYVDPFVVSAPQTALWSVGDFIFDLTIINVNNVIGSFAMLSGSGVIHKAGFADTNGEWLFSTQGAGSSFTFSATAVPEPAAIALLGLGLIGFGAARRKKQA